MPKPIDWARVYETAGSFDEIERRIVIALLKEYRGKVWAVARILNMDTSTLYRRLTKWQI